MTRWDAHFQALSEGPSASFGASGVTVVTRPALVSPNSAVTSMMIAAMVLAVGVICKVMYDEHLSPKGRGHNREVRKLSNSLKEKARRDRDTQAWISRNR